MNVLQAYLQRYVGRTSSSVLSILKDTVKIPFVVDLPVQNFAYKEPKQTILLRII
jgi:hypothetical protein